MGQVPMLRESGREILEEAVEKRVRRFPLGQNFVPEECPIVSIIITVPIALRERVKSASRQAEEGAASNEHHHYGRVRKEFILA